MPHSHLWQATADLPAIPTLNRAIEVDVCVVGAGITGLTLAHLLGSAGSTVAVLEADRVGAGTTGHTSAHLTWFPDRALHTLTRQVGRDRLATLIACQQQAIDHIEQMTAALGVDGFHRVPGWRYVEPGQRDDLDRELAELDALGIPAVVAPDAPLPFPVARALRVDRQAMFHPLRYLAGLARGLPRAVTVYGQSRVSTWTEGADVEIRTDTGVVRARDLVLATHTPLGRMLRIQARIAPYVSYLLVLRLERPLTPGLYWDTADPYHYHRPLAQDAPDVALIGGSDHRPGAREASTVLAELEDWARRRFRVVERLDAWVHEWFEPSDGLPFVGRAPGTERTWVATGYAGNGLTLGTAAALQLAAQLQGRAHPWADAFGPSRAEPLRTTPNLLKENLENALHFLGDRLAPGGEHDLRTLPPGQGRVIRDGAHVLAVHRSEDGELSALSPVCTHLGCVVGWNDAEGTWDCPCHGGRYAADGTPIYGPPLAPLARRRLPGEP